MGIEGRTTALATPLSGRTAARGVAGRMCRARSSPDDAVGGTLGRGVGVETPLNETIDPNGNLTSDGSKTYEWDAENRLVRVTEGGTQLASFLYDAHGIRTRKTVGTVTTNYVRSRRSVVEERSSTGGITKHFGGRRFDEWLASDGSMGVRYYTHDHLGSVRETTDAAGAVVLRRAYGPWGDLLAGGDFGGWAFSGREWDPEIGLYYYRARYYDPRLGRFLSGDPVGLRGGMNLYGYVLNRPTRFTDPMGLCAPAPCTGWFIPECVQTESSCHVETYFTNDCGDYAHGSIAIPGRCEPSRCEQETVTWYPPGVEPPGVEPPDPSDIPDPDMPDNWWDPLGGMDPTDVPETPDGVPDIAPPVPDTPITADVPPTVE
jgi:RHS repeat-associated protein